MPQATGEFQIDSWDEQTYQDLEGGAKLTRATVTQTFSGDIQGSGSVEWLMAYRPDGTARYVGIQWIEGTLGGRSGSFIAETIGDFAARIAKWEWAVVSGSATDELAGLEGNGRFEAPHGGKATFDIEYRLT